MKKVMYPVLLFCLFSVLHVYAYTGFDICNYGNEQVKNVICYGPAVMKGTTVVGDVKVAGTFKASNITAGTMNIAGSATIDTSKIAGLTEIAGSLYAEKVTFGKDLIVSAESVTLHGTTVKGSVEINSQTTKPYLRLECSSVVAGSVTFDGLGGVIQVTDDSIVQGKIVNGTMEFVKQKCK